MIEDLEEKGELMNKSISYQCVCRTAPATPGLLKITELEKSVKEMTQKIKYLEGELAKNKISTENHTNNTDEMSCEECDYRCGNNLH